jgi:glucokinase
VRWLGLDLGGTNIKSVVVQTDGEAVVIGCDTTETGARDGPAAVVERLAIAGQEAIDRWGPVDGCGVGVPGTFDSDAGTIELFPNLPGPWRGQPMVEPLQRALGVPVSIINDARAFTLAESRIGAAADASTAACFVLGTGIGGGVVVDGRLHFGPHGRAGELAHQIVVRDGPPCGCGNRGCLEAVASSRALAALAGQPTIEDVFRAAATSDQRAVDAIETVADHLGVAIANVITMLVPERVVIGGGVAGAGTDLLEPIRRAVGRHSVLVPPDWYEIVPAALGPYAGAIGAALWAHDQAMGARA